jgi:hypothetical protein
MGTPTMFASKRLGRLLIDNRGMAGNIFEEMLGHALPHACRLPNLIAAKLHMLQANKPTKHMDACSLSRIKTILTSEPVLNNHINWGFPIK